MAGSSQDQSTRHPQDDPLSSPVQFLKGVGPLRAQLLEKLNIRTAQDLLFHIPVSIDDYSELCTVPELEAGTEQAVYGEVVDRDVRHLRGGRTLTGVLLNCDGHFVRGVWFNQPWMLKRFKEGDRLIFRGKPAHRSGRWEFNNPSVSPLHDDEEPDQSAGILPRYPLTEGIRMEGMRKMTRSAAMALADQLLDPLPAFLRERLELPDLPSAVRALHAPADRDEWEAGRRRVLLQDLLEFQLGLALRRRMTRQLTAPRIEVSARVNARIRRLFPFRLTAGQESAIQDLIGDLNSEQPMHRLLQADVGAGKTAVAAYALLAAIAADCQAVLMAPTEVLAGQHWETLDELLAGSRVQRGLLLGGMPAARRRETLQQIADGSMQLIIGTQALIQDSVEFHRLGVVVIDEQHRFGVRQRSRFSTGGFSPHVLVMTATPIPRSLCLTQFGDLDVSQIRDLPPGRQKVITARISNAAEEQKVWAFVEQQVAAGRQAYVVCPRVEGQSENDNASAEQLFAQLRRGPLQQLRLDLLHGQMEREQRHTVMDRFRSGDTDVLVSTTVIEVGVNVPNATIMVIQQAERFGIAQLHQLRGRICRGSHQGFCFLLSESETPEAVKRLTALTETTDGFELAELDAELRGPGDILGLRQSGAMPLRYADPIRDLELLKQSRVIAQQLIENGEFDSSDCSDLRAVVLLRFSRLFDLPQTG